MSLNERSQHDKHEILAPAGDKDSLIAAINNNADAVYLGLDDFNARVKAENFSKDNIGEVVRYAHLFGVKVYNKSMCKSKSRCLYCPRSRRSAFD